MKKGLDWHGLFYHQSEHTIPIHFMQVLSLTNVSWTWYLHRIHSEMRNCPLLSFRSRNVQILQLEQLHVLPRPQILKSVLPQIINEYRLI